MKAFVVSRYGAGGLEPADVATPASGPLDVLVDIRAASINPGLGVTGALPHRGTTSRSVT